MKVAGFDLFEYELPLTQPIVTKDETLSSRRGFLVKLSTDSGVIGWGEIAPLPGFSRESLASVKQQTLKLKSTLIGSNLPDDLTPEEKDGVIGGFQVTWLRRCDVDWSLQFGTLIPPKNPEKEFC